MHREEVIRISKVVVTENSDTLTVGLSKANDYRYWIFQCAQTPPSQDDKTTHTDTYCIMNDEGAIYYGGVTRIELSENVLNITLSSLAAQELGVLPSCVLRMQIPAEYIKSTCDGLHQILTYGDRSQRPTFVNI